MYFPYLRGRQFELIALRELVENSLLSPLVIPIIEPVKLSSTIITTIKSFEKNKRKIALIMNPQVGDFTKKLTKEENAILKDKFIETAKLSKVIKTHILNSNSENEIYQLFENGVKPEDLIIICNNEDYIETYGKSFTEDKPQFNLILDESIFRRRIRDNRVILADKFKKRERNSAYAGKDEDESFSHDHLYYEDDGYVGFSDYSVVGDEYIESGFAPYAIAIHIVYFDDDQGLRIRHFVSDTNDDINDPAQKFSEAVGKLVNWNKVKKINTVGIKMFEQMFENEVYPGLGTVKKLSIMHHIELMSQYLDGATRK